MYSPHTRGWSVPRIVPEGLEHVFPAHAGVVPWESAMFATLTRYSLHTRGWPPVLNLSPKSSSILPAHVGGG